MAKNIYLCTFESMDKQYDFKDVLILPKKSNLNSRKDVVLERTIVFQNGVTWTGIPIVAANMTTIGTLELYKVLSSYKIITALHKFHKLQDLLDYNKENSDFKTMLMEQSNMMMEVIKNGTHNTTTNSHNKSFNLQFFLNETCKDAMNIMDFVDSIKIQLCDIESIGELGYVNGMSKLIIKHLNALDENMRPVHCSDSKRDSLYVKDKNIWEKEDSENNKIKKAIKYISHKNICAIPEWKSKYPDCIYSDSKKSNQYNHIVVEAM